MSDECKFWILSKSQFQKSRKTSHRWNRFLGPGGKTPFTSRELDPRIFWARLLTIYGGKNFDPRKPEVGDFLGWPQFLGLSSSAPNGGRGSGVMAIGRSRRGVRTKIFLQKSDESFSRKFDLSLFPLGARVENKKRNGHRYDSDNKVLNILTDFQTFFADGLVGNLQQTHF